MYDTIHLYLRQDLVDSVDMLSEVPPCLDSYTTHENLKGLYYTGHLKNLTLSVSRKGVSIKGSLSKYYFGTNTKSLNRATTERAIIKLSNELQLPLSIGSISRVDFGINCIMKYKPTFYFNYLGESQYYKRSQFLNTLFYINGNRTKAFYDKLLEMKKNKESIPDDWNGKNILRYEIRHSRRLSKQLKEPDIKVSSLYQNVFYTKMFKRFKEGFMTIHKVPEFNLDIENMNTPKDLFDQLVLMQIKEMGIDGFNGLIERLREMDAFNRPEYYSKAKSEARNKMKRFKSNESENPINELLSKIDRVYEPCGSIA